jgi:hypothetical protein
MSYVGVPGLSRWMNGRDGNSEIARKDGSRRHSLSPVSIFWCSANKNFARDSRWRLTSVYRNGQRPTRQHDTEQFYNAYIDLLPQKFYLKNR